jgi:COMPASS component SWD1
MNTSLLSLSSIAVRHSASLNPFFFIDPFNITYPTAVQASLPSQCSLARFDSSGRFVAAGRSDGSAAIWDLETRAAVRWLEGHVKGITSVECVMHI